MSRPLGALALLAMLWWPTPAAAHEADPVLIDLRLYDDGAQLELDLTWTRQLDVERALREAGDADEVPWLPEGCAGVQPAPSVVAHHDRTVRRWRVRCSDGAADARTLGLAPVVSARNAVLVRLHGPQGVARTQLLDAPHVLSLAEVQEAATAAAASEPRHGAVFGRHVALGVEHILLGLDHLLFVACLILLLGTELRRLAWTLTTFTAAHSLTLALAVFDLVRLPSGAVEAAIALSLVALAAELARRDAPTSLFRRNPAVMAFAFGLLHGLGFAGALGELGVPAAELPAALAGFNLGVELGQLAFVLAWLGAATLVRALLRRPIAPAVRGVAVYAIGTLAAFWLIERIAAW